MKNRLPLKVSSEGTSRVVFLCRCKYAISLPYPSPALVRPIGRLHVRLLRKGSVFFSLFFLSVFLSLTISSGALEATTRSAATESMAELNHSTSSKEEFYFFFLSFFPLFFPLAHSQAFETNKKTEGHVTQNPSATAGSVPGVW